MPTLPLTQLDERALAADLDNRTFSLTFAQPVAIKDLLLLLVRGTTLSVIPDPAISGTFIGELKNVTVRQALQLILPPLGLDYAVDGRFVRVFRRQAETRIFDVNYLAASRRGESTTGGPVGAAGSGARVTTTTASDFFANLTQAVKSLVSDHGTFSVDAKAGLLQVTDLPERLDRVAVYLDAVQDRVQRQVQIDARVVEVELKDPAAPGIDWTALTKQDAATPFTTATRSPVTGLRVDGVDRLLAALAEQGTVTVTAAPRLLAMNNEPALVRATVAPAGADAEAPSEAISLSVTPQIAGGGAVMLSVSPIVVTRTGGGDRAPGEVVRRESDTLARVANGETIVLAGFSRERQVTERRNAGYKGGWFGRSTVTVTKRTELVILLTPRVLTGAVTQ
jgi:MSHA biogenesis protein MshL